MDKASILYSIPVQGALAFLSCLLTWALPESHEVTSLYLPYLSNPLDEFFRCCGLFMQAQPRQALLTLMDEYEEL